MRLALSGAGLGLVAGAVVGGIVTTLAQGGSIDAAYLRNTLCVVLGAGLGSLTGAVIGGVGAIVTAIQRHSQR
jgi:hypothetical protein